MFVRGYGSIARPLTNMLKKDSFHWSEEAKVAFQSLKDSLMQSPVLALPDFSKVFVVEVDASGSGIGAVLMQDHHPMTFISRALNMQQQSLCSPKMETLSAEYSLYHQNRPQKPTVYSQPAIDYSLPTKMVGQIDGI